MDETCHEHSGCISDINNLKSENSDIWREINSMRDKTDGIMVKLNVLLGGLAISLIMLVFDLITKRV